MPGPCDPVDLLDGVIFGAKYLGSTQLKSDRNPSTNARMTQAQEAVDRIKVNNRNILDSEGQHFSVAYRNEWVSSSDQSSSDAAGFDCGMFACRLQRESPSQ